MNRVLLIILSIISIASTAQVNQPERFEIEQEFGDRDFSIISAEEYGIVLVRELRDFNSENGDMWEVIILDTHLKEKNRAEIPVENDHNFVGFDFYDGTFYMLFDKEYTTKDDWLLTSISLKDGHIAKREIRNELKINLTHFIISGKSAILGGEVEGKPTIKIYQFENESVEVLPGFYRDETTLVEVKSNENGTFNIVLLDKGRLTNQNILSVKVFSEEGIELLDGATTFPRETKVQSGTISQLQTDHLVVAGTYGDKGSKMSNGFYFINLKPGKNNEPVLTPFTELRKIFDYLPDRRRDKVFEKIKKASRNDPYEYKFTIAVWNIFEANDEYAIYAEIIDPQYGTIGQPNTIYPMQGYNPWFSPSRTYYRNTYSINDPDEIVSVKYRQAILVSFNRQGELNYDFSLPYSENIEYGDVRKHSAAYFDGNTFRIIYKNDDNEFHFSEHNSVRTVVSDSTVNIRLSKKEEELRFDEETGKVVHWYDSNFYVWGYSKIQDSISKERKNIFYINKITFE